MSTDKVTIQKLRGADNYKVWDLRTKSYLIKEGLLNIIKANGEMAESNDKALANIRFLFEDGPFLQIQNLIIVKEVWESFKTLYSLKSFFSKFFICRKFLKISLDKFSSIKEYLNKMK